MIQLTKLLVAALLIISSIVDGETNQLHVEKEQIALYGLGTVGENRLTWSEKTPVMYYSILKSDDGISNWKEIERIQPKNISMENEIYSITDLSPNHVTYYKVISVEASQTQISNLIKINRRVSKQNQA